MKTGRNSEPLQQNIMSLWQGLRQQEQKRQSKNISQPDIIVLGLLQNKVTGLVLNEITGFQGVKEQAETVRLFRSNLLGVMKPEK